MKNPVTGKGTLESIRVAEIRPNAWNGNRTADDGLVESVRQHGILQPICVEKDKDGKGYVCVFGARRLDAARETGMKAIPAYVLPARLAKGEARLLTLVENMQREPQDPVTEGFIYKALIEGGLSEAEVAERSGAGRRAVRQRLALTKLCPQAVELLQSMPYKLAAVAMLAECTPSQQVKIIEGKPYLLENPWEMEEEIKGERPLLRAPFDTEDAELVPGAGPCSKCPKRTGAQALLFDGAPEDAGSCLDAACHAAKVAAHVGREVAKIRKANPTAKCVVDLKSYAFATPEHKAVYDGNGAEPMKEMRLASSEADKASPEAQTAILLNQGTVREVVVVPAPRQKDGRAAKPKTPEEKAEYTEKKRLAWIANQTSIRLVKWLGEVKGGEKPFEGQDELLLLLLGRALAGECLSYPEARRRVVEGLWRALTDVLCVPALFALNPEIMTEKIRYILLLTAPAGEDCTKTLERLKAEAEEAVP